VQYLVLDESRFEGKDGHLYACCPQLKKEKDWGRLWKGLKQGEVCVVSTDTCTFTREQKARWDGDWTKIPMGLPGLETLLPLMFTTYLRGMHFSPSEVVEKCCTNPARIMGLYPRKGVIARGSDADVVIIDPKKEIKVDHAKMQGGADWSPYQGWELWGWAETTFSRGRKIVDNYQFVGANGWGRWLPREKAGDLPHHGRPPRKVRRKASARVFSKE
jgi:dihydropyrimidinase